jgi:hypothetical protein
MKYLYSRKPNPSEIHFGHGCTIYADIPEEIVLKDGKPKKRVTYQGEIWTRK